MELLIRTVLMVFVHVGCVLAMLTVQRIVTKPLQTFIQITVINYKFIYKYSGPYSIMELFCILAMEMI